MADKKINIFERLYKFAINLKESDLDKISNKKEYQQQFKGKTAPENSKIYHAYTQAWDARKFEIDNYWKRTTYFWAFQVTSFAAYFAIVSSAAYNSTKTSEILFCVIAFGFITSMAWSLINIGSKFWQRHWEKHIDMLENKVTGPLYKTVYAYKNIKTFSVSKLNSIISRFFVVIWFILGIKYFVDHLAFCGEKIAWVEITILIVTLYFICAMFLGYGRGNFGSADFNFYKRSVFKEGKTNN